MKSIKTDNLKEGVKNFIDSFRDLNENNNGYKYLHDSTERKNSKWICR